MASLWKRREVDAELEGKVRIKRPKKRLKDNEGMARGEKMHGTADDNNENIKESKDNEREICKNNGEKKCSI